METPKQKTYTVLELNDTIKQILEGSFPELIWIRGEITGFDKQKNRKHIYIQLQEKDPDKDQIISEIPAVIFNSDIAKIWQKLREANVDTALRDGMEVRVLCRVNVYPPHGKYTLIIKDIDPEFILGKLARSREMIIQYLKSKGLLEKNKKIPLPLVPQSIGLITQVNTEGYNDFLSKLRESNFTFKVKFYNSSVQGKNVEQEVCTALDYFNKQQDVDVVVITRGGGAKTDLSWFDNKKIAEKIAFSQIPVLTGIGHKTDYTITDMVAFSSQQSPSAVATFLVDCIRDFLQSINEISVNIAYSTENYLRSALQELEETKTRLSRESLLFLQDSKEKINRTWTDFSLYCEYFFRSTKDTINKYKSNINFLDPINTLQRGFSITRINGKAIKSISKVKKGQNMVTIVSDGNIKSIVNVTKPSA